MPGTSDIIWQALATHKSKLANTRLTDLFDRDPERVSRYQISAAGLLLDYSKNLITDETLNLFSQLIDVNALPHRVQLMMEGEKVNVTENRRALHTLLRTRANKAPEEFETEAQKIADTLSRMESISESIRSGEWTGATGKRIKHIVHIGIGGSYLGPRMVSEALMPYASRDINAHYIANVDGHHIDYVLSKIDPEETLLIVASKTFTTLETMVNAETARQWMLSRIPSTGLGQHVIAITGNIEAATRFGVNEGNLLPMWDWVGGRYSLWSAIGLPVAITSGFKNFRALLDGAALMDAHFDEAPWPENMPMMLALLGIWYHNFYGAQSHAVLPYDHWLRLLPAHLQQLDMESNGKSVTRNGDKVNWETGPIVWGGEGTNGQHAFHQLLHQGTHLVSVDFILPLTAHHKRREHHEWLVANCLAQSQALMQGRDASSINGDPRTRPHRAMPGDRPSNMIVMDKVTPETLGALIALYEHKVFCQAMIWHINPFDQWGVELGKELGVAIHDQLTGDNEDEGHTLDASTRNLIRHYKSRLKR